MHVHTYIHTHRGGCVCFKRIWVGAGSIDRTKGVLCNCFGWPRDGVFHRPTDLGQLSVRGVSTAGGFKRGSTDSTLTHPLRVFHFRRDRLLINWITLTNFQLSNYFTIITRRPQDGIQTRWYRCIGNLYLYIIIYYYLALVFALPLSLNSVILINSCIVWKCDIWPC